MKAQVDQLKCRTAGICGKLCPQVFRFQEGSKRAAVMMAHIPSEYWNACRKAASQCPNNAITIQEPC